MGLLAGGVTSALALWLFSGLFSPIAVEARYAVIVVVALLCALRDAGLLRVALPQNARQIPQDVLQRHLLRGSLQFGYELGTGVRTYVSASAPYTVAVGVLLAGGGVLTALAVGLGFGAGRAVTPALRLASGDVTGWDARMTQRLRPMAVGTAVVLVALFAMLGGGAG